MADLTELFCLAPSAFIFHLQEGRSMHQPYASTGWLRAVCRVSAAEGDAPVLGCRVNRGWVDFVTGLWLWNNKGSASLVPERLVPSTQCFCIGGMAAEVFKWFYSNSMEINVLPCPTKKEITAPNILRRASAINELFHLHLRVSTTYFSLQGAHGAWRCGEPEMSVCCCRVRLLKVRISCRPWEPKNMFLHIF